MENSEKKLRTGEWRFIPDANFGGIRDDSGFICFLTTPSRYAGQEERYLKEMEEYEATKNLLLCAPRMLKFLEDFAETFDRSNGIEYDLSFFAKERGKVEMLIQKAKGL